MQVFSLTYAEPYRFPEVLSFFRGRACAGVELIDDVSYSRTVRMRPSDAPDGYVEGWLRVEQESGASALRLTLSGSLVPVSDQVIARIRSQFDLDCEPAVIHEAIISLNDTVAGAAVLGTRVPGCFDPFETCCRAVLGQQVSVKAANSMAARLIDRFGADIPTGIDGLSKLFPTPEAIAAIDDIEGALGSLGIIRNRSRVIRQIACMVLDGSLDLSLDADPEQLIDELIAIKGIGPWTANYIAMRTVKHPDAFLETDVGVKHALPGMEPKEILALAEAWRPYRAYANICLWNSLD